MNETNNIILNLEDVQKTYSTNLLSEEKFKKWLPIRKNSELAAEFAYLVSKITGDGNLDEKFTARFIGQEEELRQIKNLLTNKLSINPNQVTIRGKRAKGKSFLLQVNNSYFGRTLYALGTPLGNKTLVSFGVPKWIRDSKTYSKLFLQGMLEDELTTLKIEKCNYCNKVRFNMRKHTSLKKSHMNFMVQIKDLIERFEVDCSPVKELKIEENDRVEYYFWIYRNKTNIIRFAENIGFRFHTNKIEHLEKVHKILTETHKPKPSILEIFELRKRGFRIRKIAGKLKTSRSTVHRTLR